MSAYARLLATSIPLAVLMAGSAHAATRSSDAIPAKAQASAQTSSTVQASPQGPKNGFPNNAGLDRAREVANENARFQRTDSAG